MTPSFPCARCGRPVHRLPASRTRPRRIACARCGYLLYDYPRPCAGVLVVKGADVLMLRRAHPPRVGGLDIPGGFLEAGESIEGCARRELREETGLTVGTLEPLGFYWDEYSLKGFGRFPTMNWYYAGNWHRGTPAAADDAASAAWLPLASILRRRRSFSWAHMPAVLHDLQAWARGNQREASSRARASRSATPSSRAQRSR